MKTVTDFPRKVKEIENLWIPMSDGVRLAARMWIPEDAEEKSVPAIVEYLPYRKRDGTIMRDALTHPYFAGHGYAAIRIDMRGGGDSEGLMFDEYSKQEQDDAVEAITWLASQKWCSGTVGMMGISWGGFNSLQVAARKPPALKAIITLCSTDAIRCRDRASPSCAICSQASAARHRSARSAAAISAWIATTGGNGRKSGTGPP